MYSQLSSPRLATQDRVASLLLVRVITPPPQPPSRFLLTVEYPLKRGTRLPFRNVSWYSATSGHSASRPYSMLALLLVKPLQLEDIMDSLSNTRLSVLLAILSPRWSSLLLKTLLKVLSGPFPLVAFPLLVGPQPGRLTDPAACCFPVPCPGPEGTGTW